MGTILLIILLVLLFGGGGGYYAHGRYGGAELGGVLGLVVLVLVVLWLFGERRRHGQDLINYGPVLYRKSSPG